MDRKAVIFYFSGTGNTWWCGQRLAESLSRRGIGTEALSIEGVRAGQVREATAHADLVGLGYPVYGSDLPEPFKEFCSRTLPEAHPRREAFVFCTQLLFSGDGAEAFGRELGERGYGIRWSAHFLMPNNICLTAVPLPWIRDPRRLADRLGRTRTRIEAFASAIAGGGRFRDGAGPLSRTLGLIQRAPFRRYGAGFRDRVDSDPARCGGCGYCRSVCPVGNVVMESGRPSFLGRCCLCMRCYDFCPESAVRFFGKGHKERRGAPYRGPVPGSGPRS